MEGFVANGKKLKRLDCRSWGQDRSRRLLHGSKGSSLFRYSLTLSGVVSLSFTQKRILLLFARNQLVLNLFSSAFSQTPSVHLFQWRLRKLRSSSQLRLSSVSPSTMLLLVLGHSSFTSLYFL